MSEIVENKTSQEIVSVAPQSPVERMLSMLERVATDPNADAAKAKAFLEMQKEIMLMQGEIDFNDAKARIKEALLHVKIVKTRQVLHDIDKNDKAQGKKEAYRYAALEDIDQVVSPILVKEGMSDSYRMEPIKEGWYNVICTLSKGSYSKDYPMPLPLDTSGKKSNIQYVGSTQKYGQRYALTGAIGLVVIGMDDDGIGGAIDDVQAKYIKDLLKETESDTAKFLKWLNVKSVEEILYKDYRKATHQLEKKKKQEQK